jgi:transcription elongation factor GreA-like protein
MEKNASFFEKLVKKIVNRREKSAKKNGWRKRQALRTAFPWESVQ